MNEARELLDMTDDEERKNPKPEIELGSQEGSEIYSLA
jgi:hypothetical protein